MKVQEIGGRHIVFGATWVTLPGAETQMAEIKKSAKEARSKVYVSIARKGQRPLFGFVKKTIGRKPNYSAAALISVLVPGVKNAIFSFRFKDDQSAIICFVDGLPMVGFDLVGEAEAMELKLHEFLASSANVTLYGDFSAFSADFVDVQAFDFQSITFEDARVAHAIFRRASIPPSIWFGLFGLISLTLGSYFGYDWYQNEQLRAARLKQVNPNVAYEGNVQRLLGEAGFPVGAAMQSIIPTITQIPIFMGGWKLNGGSCSVGNCKISWVSEPTLPSTFEGFKISAPENWYSEYKSDYQSIESSVDIEAQVKLGVDKSALQKSDDYVILIGTEIQRLRAIGADFQLNKPQLFGVPQLPPEQPPITLNTLKAPVLEGIWSISGPWWLAEYLQSLPPSMTLDSVSISNTARGINMKAEGKYYVNK